ncbi:MULTISPECIES: hypothetical protein [Gordonia]|uniref:Uncharacterized protein n=1 Tax=Gordonia sihwensis NBRC 108236 TaxID=1223544 RepID=L7LHP4_9ACTN|nr:MULTISPECIES: hypothetical protein [Gordonia]AUH68505.1 hypothetical protein CXX93_09265 [Gordonia sp. YC-JH1]GAC60635.1 hypothetical protein GSI01S_10_02290 [Gordonia sihwensis NBRC 108236]
MNQIDETMRALLAVYRADLNDRDEQIANLTYRANEAERLRADLKRESEKNVDAVKVAMDLRSDVKDANTKIKKLEGIIESLKIELVNAREAATAAKEGRIPNYYSTATVGDTSS